MDGRRIKDLHKCGEEMSKNSSLPSREQQETSELNGSGGGRGKGIRGPRPFVPVGNTNRDKMGAFCPGWRIQPGQKARVPFCSGWNHQPGQKAPILSRLVSPTVTKGLGPLSPSLSPPARAIQLTCFMLFSAREGGVLAHFFTTFVKIFDSLSIHRC